MQVHALSPTCTRRSLLRGFGWGTMGIVAGVATGCTTSSTDSSSPATKASVDSPRPTIATPAPQLITDVTSFGAVGDGRTDDTAALMQAFAALKPGHALRLPRGKIFNHARVLSLSTPNTWLLGPGTLNATNEEVSALKIEAAGVTVDGVTLSITHTSQRWSTPDQHKLYLGPYRGIVVSDVNITGSAAAGLFCLGASYFRLLRVRVSDTRADGIHMTYGSNNATVESPVITRSGDDGVAVVSYVGDQRVCASIDITSPVIRTTTGGRGISVVGGQHITYHDIDISRSNAAAVYIACEGGPSGTTPAHDVRVLGGRIDAANTNAGINHGSVLVYSGRNGGNVSDVVISGLTIAQTRSTAARQIGVVDNGGNPVSDIVFADIHMAATSPPPYQGDAPTSAFTLRNVTAAGKKVSGAR